MPQIGPMEIMLVMVVALLVFGPEKLPEMARNLGRTASQLRRMAQDMKDNFSTALDDDEEDRPAPGSASTRPRAAGALPADDKAAEEVDESSSIQASAGERSDDTEDAAERTSIEKSARGGSGTDAEDSESESIKDDLEHLNRQQQDAESTATTAPIGDSQAKGRE
jgi:Tat protein translocase TatB subunit